MRNNREREQIFEYIFFSSSGIIIFIMTLIDEKRENLIHVVLYMCRRRHSATIAQYPVKISLQTKEEEKIEPIFILSRSNGNSIGSILISLITILKV